MICNPDNKFYISRSMSAGIYIPAETNSVQYFWGSGMWQYKKKPLSWVFVSRMIGIICFLIIVVLANILTYYVSNDFRVYHLGVTFLNENFWLLILITVILLAADIFDAFPFPFNLPSPLVRAIGSVFCIAFILRGIQWLDTVAGTNLYTQFWLILVSLLIVPLIFLIVLTSGYYAILRQLSWQPKIDEVGYDTLVVHDEYQYQASQQVTDAKSWEEIGIEFRLMLFDILHRFREDIRKKK